MRALAGVLLFAVSAIAAGPLQGVDSVVFATRSRYADGHWYANIGYFCDDSAHKAYSRQGKLWILDLASGEARVLLDAGDGCVRDPQLHYDGKKILFALRKSGKDPYHLHEINIDGSGLRQLTDGAYDDFEPTYLPDGGIIFVSTRCKRWVNCYLTQVAVLHRCDADGGNIRQLSANMEHDNTPWVMPDGRILYTRWEYVDRSQMGFHHLWTMNPDGSNQTVFYGNMHHGKLMIDAKPIPNSNRVVVSFSPGHGRNEHEGAITLLSSDLGPDDPRAAVTLLDGYNSRDPYPLGDGRFLVARKDTLLLLDQTGETKILYTAKGEDGLHEPRPVRARPRERIIPPRSDWSKSTGRFILSDVYNGRNMEGVKRGDISDLLILESLPKPVNFSGGMDLTSFLGTFTLERVLGTVPVAEDGSAVFDAPANRALIFAALDKQGRSVKRMHSFTSVMPGETLSCAGCHEDRKAAGASPQFLAAMSQPLAAIKPFADVPDVYDYLRDIQPILDRHCVSCHGPEDNRGKLYLGPGLGVKWSLSYYALVAGKQIADGRNGLGNQAPRSFGSGGSALMKMIDGSHHGAKPTPREQLMIRLWLDSGAPYAGSYGGLRNQVDQARSGLGLAVFHEQHGVIKRRCGSCHADDGQAPKIPTHFDVEDRRKQVQRETATYERVIFDNDPLARFSIHILVNISKPEHSPLILGPLAKSAGGWGRCPEGFANAADPDFRALLASLKTGQERLLSKPLYGMPDFQPNPQYIREMRRFGILAADSAGPVDVFALDRAYWKSFWHRPR